MNGRFPEDRKPADEQCKHCEKYFHTRGIVAHRRHCPYQDRDYTAVNGNDSGSSSDPEQGEESDSSTDGVAGGSDPEPSPPDQGSRTDGSGLGLEGPPETTTDVDDDQEDDEPNTADCPACGEDLGVTEDELAAMDSPRCAECGTGVSVS